MAERHWDRFPGRLEENADHALRLLSEHSAKATFFVDPWIAARYEATIRGIANEGHEVAALIGPARRISRDVSELEQVSGRVVQGCRISTGLKHELQPAALWDAGLRYCLGAGSNWMGDQTSLKTAPSPGFKSRGEWLRLQGEAALPKYLASWGKARTSRTFAFNLWELDSETPCVATHTAMSRMMMHRGLDRFPQRLAQLRRAARFGSVRDQLGVQEEPFSRPPVVSVPVSRAKLAKAATGQPVSIVIPCYNECENLPYLLRALDGLSKGFGTRHPLRFVLVDDGSVDGTWSEMRRLFEHDPRFRLVQHPANRGIGAAICTGILAAEDEIVAIMDSDCSYDPARIEDMLPLLDSDVAMVPASPYHPLGGVEGVPEWRLFLSRGASSLYRRVLRNKLATYTSCFRVCRKSAVADLALTHEGYIGVVEMLVRLDFAGWRIAEHPVVLESRLLGRSKLRIVKTIAGHLRFLGEISRARLSETARPSLTSVPR